MRTRLAGLIGVAGLVGGLATPAIANATTITATANGLTGTYTMAQGERPIFVNSDVPSQVHSIRSTLEWYPHFGSLVTVGPAGDGIKGGTSTPVDGAEYLTTGSYPLFDPFGLGGGGTVQATLIVTSAGTPVPRPRATIQIASQRLRQVAAKGKVELSVTSIDASADIFVSAQPHASAGEGTLATVRTAPGTTKAVTVQVSPRYARKLAKKRSAKLVARALPRFGVASTASKRLH